MKEIIKLGIILCIIAAVAAAALGYINEITMGPIEEQKILADTASRKETLPEAEDFTELEVQSPDQFMIIAEVYEGTAGGNTVGYTLKTTPTGYGGIVEVMVGINAEGIVTGVKIGNHTETPGLGAKASDDEFKNQYQGKTSDMVITVIKAGEPSDDEIASISGATITSEAVTKGVNEAIKYYNENLK